jgi:hypothetical protein
MNGKSIVLIYITLLSLTVFALSMIVIEKHDTATLQSVQTNQVTLAQVTNIAANEAMVRTNSLAEMYSLGQRSRFPHPATLTTNWQYQPQREQQADLEAETELYRQQAQTNMEASAYYFSWKTKPRWRPQPGMVELGYKSDGTVTWRPIPEAQQ